MKHVEEIARLMKLREYEPEVALAVRIRGGAGTKEIGSGGGGGDGGENGDIDSMLMSFGFEYVDATRTVEETSAEDEIDGTFFLKKALLFLF